MAVVSPDRVRAVVEPVLDAEGLELVDLQVGPGLVRVFVDVASGADAPAALDIDRLGGISERVSAALDDDDPMPGRYTLEVSSPGVERPLRTPEHFRRFVGSRVAVKTVPSFSGERRVEGRLERADERGVTVTTDSGDASEIAYDDIERARTVFEWPAAEKPGQSKKKRAPK